MDKLFLEQSEMTEAFRFLLWLHKILINKISMKNAKMDQGYACEKGMYDGWWKVCEKDYKVYRIRFILKLIIPPILYPY